MHDLFSNNDYIDWLISFSQNINSFTEYNWLYDYLDFTEIDQENLKKLNLFYEAIDKYAKENLLSPISDNNETFYRVKMDNHGFEIGIIHERGIHFCRKKVIDKNEFIDLNDILTKNSEIKSSIKK